MNAKNIRRRANAWRKEATNERTSISNHEQNKTHGRNIATTTINKQHSSKLAFAHNIKQMRLLLLWLRCAAAFFFSLWFVVLCFVFFCFIFVYLAPIFLNSFIFHGLQHVFFSLISLSNWYLYLFPIRLMRSNFFSSKSVILPYSSACCFFAVDLCYFLPFIPFICASNRFSSVWTERVCRCVDVCGIAEKFWNSFSHQHICF